MRSRRMRARFVVVFDTNVLIPLSVPSGRSRSTRILSRLRAAGCRVAISPQIQEEVQAKMRTKQSLRRWLQLSDEETERFVVQLPGMLGRILKGTVTTPGAVKADPKDDMIIAAAVEAKASYIVSEDRHLLDLREFEGIRIMSIDEFAVELDRLHVP